MVNTSHDSSSSLEGTMSLLSLSIAASNADPIPTLPNKSPTVAGSGGNVGNSTSIGSNIKHHRRMSSDRLRRRLSDAKEAASRPSLVPPTALSVSSSSRPTPAPISISQSVPASATVQIKPIIIDSKTKKRGMDYKCESCSKVYRHPSCLIKHRWEHTPHWREASKFVLSKHQQVQLLEAAAILSHLSPNSSTGTSLPEDRSMWPSFLSGGSLPTASALSVPNHTDTTGPRLHDYTVPASVSTGNITHLRPGLIGVSTSTSSWSSRSRSNELEEAEEEEDDQGRIWKQEDEDDDDAFSVDINSKNGEWEDMAMDMDMD